MAFTIYDTQWNREKTIQGVLFDMDGLVLDTECLYSRFWQEAAVSLGYPMTREQSLGMRALNAVAGQKQLESYFGPGINYQQVRQVRIQRMNAYIAAHGVAPKPGIRELLQYLKGRKIPAALATSSPLDRVEAYMGPLGLLPWFQALCSGYNVPHGKPEPDIFLYAAEKIGVPPENCLVLEDSPAGILSASCAGCFPVIVPDQDQPSPETQALLSARADSLLDVIDLLEAVR